MATAPLVGRQYLSRLIGVAPPQGGRWQQAALGGNVFWMGTAIASGGVGLPKNAATLAATFSLYNPASSGKFVELIRFVMALGAATEVINAYAVGFQTNVSAAGAPTSTTAIDNGPSSTLLGLGLASVCNGYKAATMTNAAVLPIFSLGMTVGATTIQGGPIPAQYYDFDGQFLLPPDTMAAFVVTVGAGAAQQLSLTWAEWPLA